MNKRAVVVLALVAAALVAYVALFERTSLTSKELDERKARVLTSFVRAKVDRLQIERKGKRVVLERKPDEAGQLGAFRMLEPVSDAADEDAVDQVLGELEWLTARRTLDGLTDADLKSFGLDAPRYRVGYRVAGESHTLTIGSDDVHGDGIYARVDEERSAFVVPKTLVEALDHDPGRYRGKEFLGQMTVAWAQRIELEHGGAKQEISKEGGRFVVLGDPRSYADAKRIDDLLHGLDDLRATRFLEPEAVGPAESDLGKPASVVRVRIVPEAQREDRAPQLVELQLGGACAGHDGERYARAGEKGAPVCIKAEDAKPFEPGPSELRMRSVFAADPSEVERFELVVGTQKLVAKRDGEKWVPEGALEVDRSAVERWLADLGVQRATGFLPSGSFVERGSLTLKLVGDKSERIAFGPAADGVLVKRGDEPALVRFGQELALLLEPSPQRFASLEPWAKHQPSEIVALAARDGATQRSLVLADGAWRASPKAAEVSDGAKVRELLRALVKLETLGFVSDGVRPEQGLSTPRARLVLTLAPPQTAQLTLEIGEVTSRGAYARIDGGRVVEVATPVLAQVAELAGVAPPPTQNAPAEHDAGADVEHEHDHEGHAHEVH